VLLWSQIRDLGSLPSAEIEKWRTRTTKQLQQELRRVNEDLKGVRAHLMREEGGFPRGRVATLRRGQVVAEGDSFALLLS